MIKLSDIEYTDQPVSTTVIALRARVQLHAVIPVRNDEFTGKLAARLKQEVASHIWRSAYGEITDTLPELRRVVLGHTKPDGLPRAQELLDQLERLLKPVWSE